LDTDESYFINSSNSIPGILQKATIFHQPSNCSNTGKLQCIRAL
jgi:hypothetical protein